jgi:hypothetical protein
MQYEQQIVENSNLIGIGNRDPSSYFFSLLFGQDLVQFFRPLQFGKQLKKKNH